mmetsp:Transcript_25337/g.55396  ORF Transcript_25337/g.55396 Transcript_25337/m.55396 type:complete len:202 (+) Transcript_25337:1780-2385(+)
MCISLARAASSSCQIAISRISFSSTARSDGPSGVRRKSRRKWSSFTLCIAGWTFGMKPSSAPASVLSAAASAASRAACSASLHRKERQRAPASDGTGSSRIVHVPDSDCSFRARKKGCRSCSRSSSTPVPSARHSKRRGGWLQSGSSPLLVSSSSSPSTVTVPPRSSFSTSSTVWPWPRTTLNELPSGSLVLTELAARSNL